MTKLQKDEIKLGAYLLKKTERLRYFDQYEKCLPWTYYEVLLNNERNTVLAVSIDSKNCSMVIGSGRQLSEDTSAEALQHEQMEPLVGDFVRWMKAESVLDGPSVTFKAFNYVDHDTVSGFCEHTRK